ncbi:TetR/AcrR family transcriptional regulator [Actinomadura sp. ATCC 31491]|uniref:TetR/AcrR family transcriptional regulator n=1 Tax=Actinomadura luzonensis TaxID=2805427 RepID=A0ABT0G4J5_9ACTN|nr:TetR/AcrR family transcriptional regulator [Actinomadura luzonensis]MCK2219490.1 TetR/AcrR family transcriptional regulator [Actinomadura luzonensis]
MSRHFTSVWTREPRRPAGAAPGRSREEIVRAAVELLDAEGLDGLSMRKLGAKLMSGATSLYWYVATKDELLELAYDEVWGEIKVPDPDEAHWREVASVLAHSLRQAMLRHPWTADLIGRLPALGPHAIEVSDRMRRTFRLAGFSGWDIDFAGATLTAFIFGMTTPEIAWNTSMGDDFDPDEARAMLRRVAAQHPDLLEAADTAHYEDPRLVRAMAFDFGLVSVLDGLERRLTGHQGHQAARRPDDPIAPDPRPAGRPDRP